MGMPWLYMVCPRSHEPFYLRVRKIRMFRSALADCQGIGAFSACNGRNVAGVIGSALTIDFSPIVVNAQAQNLPSR